MKKLLGLLLAVTMLLALLPGVSAATQITLDFDLTCEGLHEVTKQPGDIITVRYAVQNTTDETAPYIVSSMANEIYYDHTFFEYVDGSSSVEAGLNQSTKLSVYSNARHYIFFNGFEYPAKQYAADCQIGTFRLKVIATAGSSTLVSTRASVKHDGSSDPYLLTTSNLTVHIGDGSNPDVPSNLNGRDHFAYIVGYNDGTVRPEASITRAEVATIFFRLMKEDVRNRYLTEDNDFEDVNPEAWYNTAISTMAKMGILKGFAGYFRPDDPITRAEFAAIAARFADKAGEEFVEFLDISGHWAELEILKAASHGWVQGFAGYYRPDDAITRAEAMTIINRVLCRIPETVDDLLPEMKVWSDNSDTAKWYYLAVQEATNSHTYTYKDAKHESWLALTEAPDWSKFQ